MKLSCLQENLAAALSVVGRAIPGRTAMPVLGHVLVRAEQDHLKLAATDLELSIVHWIGARIERDGAVTVPARRFADLVNSLPPVSVSLTLEEETLSLTLTCASLKAKFRGIPAEEFPIVPEPSKKEEDPTVAAADLRAALGHVIFAASEDDSHPVLTGVLMEFEEQTLTLVAADGFRLSMQTIPLVQPVPAPLSVIVPARALSELVRILNKREEPVCITTTRPHNQILFHLQDTVLNSQLIDGHFPDFRRLIPQSTTTRIMLDREAFLQTCKQVAIFAHEAGDVVDLQIRPGALAMSATAAEFGEGHKSMAVPVEGEELDITFNVRYLIEVLSELDAPQVALEMQTPTTPGVLKAVGDATFTHVIMPIRP
jgi:DNA polymerase-3 subunit beta